MKFENEFLSIELPEQFKETSEPPLLSFSSPSGGEEVVLATRPLSGPYDLASRIEAVDAAVVEWSDGIKEVSGEQPDLFSETAQSVENDNGYYRLIHGDLSNKGWRFAGLFWGSHNLLTVAWYYAYNSALPEEYVEARIQRILGTLRIKDQASSE
jgi:hypothetical protein